MTYDHTSDIPLHRTYISTCLHSTHSISFSFHHANLICHFIASCCHSLWQCSAAMLRGHLRGHKKRLSSIETVGKGCLHTAASCVSFAHASFGQPMPPNNALRRIGLTSSSCFRPPDDTILASCNKRTRRCRSGGWLP